jgi:hypothetical protein
MVDLHIYYSLGKFRRGLATSFLKGKGRYNHGSSFFPPALPTLALSYLPAMVTQHVRRPPIISSCLGWLAPSQGPFCKAITHISCTLGLRRRSVLSNKPESCAFGSLSDPKQTISIHRNTRSVLDTKMPVQAPPNFVALCIALYSA